MLGEQAYEPVVSARVRRWTRIAFLSGITAIVVFAMLVEFVERRAIDYRSAEEVFAKLKAGGFECENPYFPTGRSEPTESSTATCKRGFAYVHINVNQERGHWLGTDYSEPYESGEAAVEGRNWSVSFEAPDRQSLLFAREVQAILGGDITHPLPQED